MLTFILEGMKLTSAAGNVFRLKFANILENANEHLVFKLVINVVIFD